MAVTQNTYTGNGSTVLFSFTFPYLDDTDIKVSLNGVITTAYTLANATTVQFTTAPANGVAIRIFRQTDDSNLQSTFYPGSAIRSEDLNSNFAQNLYVTQEVNNNAVDIDGSNSMAGNLNLNNYKVVNLATPTISTDASTKGYVDSVVATGAANAAAAASSAAAAANTLDAFDDRFLGAKASEPSVDNDGNALVTGAIYFNTTTGRARVYSGSVWVNIGEPLAVTRWIKTAAGGETSLSGNDNSALSLVYTAGAEQVYLNGAHLTRGVDYVATTGTTVTGLVALTAGDVVEVVSSNDYVVGTVPDQSVTNAKVATSAGIVASKLAFTQSGSGAVTRTVDSKLKDVVSVKDFGAVGDGVADDTAAIQAALTACQLSGKALYFGCGIFLVSQIDYTLTRDLDIQLDGGTIKGTALDTPILILKGNTHAYGLTVAGPGSLDGSLRDNIGGTGSGSGLVVERTKFARITNINFIAGTKGDGKGDSAIVPSYCINTVISDCYFTGWDDHDIYATGDSAAGASQLEHSLVVKGCIFQENGAGSIRIAREFNHVSIIGNTFDNVYKAVVLAGGATNWNPGNSIVISSNIVKSCTNVAIDARYFTNGIVISNNLIHDWATSGDAVAINLRGVSNSVVSGNVLGPNNSTFTAGSTSCPTGIYLINATNTSLTLGDDGDPSYVWLSENNVVCNNRIKCLSRGSAANPGGIVDYTNGTSNIYSFNSIEDGNGVGIIVKDGTTDVTFGNTQVIHRTSTGVGFGTDDPQAALHVVGEVRAERSTNTAQFAFLSSGAGFNKLETRSPSTNASKLFLNATTDASNTTPTGGAIGLNLRVLNVDKIGCNQDDVQVYAPFKLKSYATAGLPTSGITAGSIAYDSSTNTVKFYNGSVWANI